LIPFRIGVKSVLLFIRKGYGISTFFLKMDMKKYLAMAITLLLGAALAQDQNGKKTDYYMMKNNHVLHL